MPPKQTEYAAAMSALTAAAAAFDRAKRLGYVTLSDQGTLFVCAPFEPAESDNPEQLRLDGC